MEEPVRKSILDYVRELKSLNVCRLIFVAQIAQDSEDIAQLFHDAIKERCTESVTGLLLVHPNFIIHLLESSENEIFQLCNHVFLTHAETISNAKCLFVQSDAKKRFFEKWFSKKIGDLAEEEVAKDFEDNFETATSIYRKTIINLHEFYQELWNARNNNYENFIKQLNIISKEGHPKLPLQSEVLYILKSCWGYDLVELVKDYSNLKYPHDFDDCSSVAEIIREINLDPTDDNCDSTETDEIEDN